MSEYRPNILFVFSDQQHWQACGFVDPFFETPALDRLATESTVFTNAFCTSPQCSPSRSSILTGLYPSKTGVISNIGDPGCTPLQMQTIASRLKQVGYRTGYIGKWHLGDAQESQQGWDRMWSETSWTTDELGRALGFDHDVTRRAEEFIASDDSRDAPWALFVSYNDPHGIYGFSRYAAPPVPVDLPASWYSEKSDRKPSVQAMFMTEDHVKEIYDCDRLEWEKYRWCYRDRVRLYDQELGRVLKALDRAGMSGDTVVFVTSDHGDMDTNHRLVYKGPFMYEHVIRVPLIIRLPKVFGGQSDVTRDDLVVNVDLVPTIAELAEIEPVATDGLSLGPLLTGRDGPSTRGAVVAEYYAKSRPGTSNAWITPIRMFRTRRWKLNHYLEYGTELYDLNSDPNELTNLADNAAYAEVRGELERRLGEWTQLNADPFFTQRPTTQAGLPLPLGMLRPPRTGPQ